MELTPTDMLVLAVLAGTIVLYVISEKWPDRG
jgi:hypothetical protein